MVNLTPEEHVFEYDTLTKIEIRCKRCENIVGDFKKVKQRRKNWIYPLCLLENVHRKFNFFHCMECNAYVAYKHRSVIEVRIIRKSIKLTH